MQVAGARGVRAAAQQHHARAPAAGAHRPRQQAQCRPEATRDVLVQRAAAPRLGCTDRASRTAHLAPAAYGQSYGMPAGQFAGLADRPASPPPLGGGALVSAGDAGGGALKAKEAPKMVQVRFWLKFHVDYGQSIRIIGGHEATGAWNLAKAPFLRWSDGDLWNVTLELAAGGVYEYKYVVVESDGTTAASWQRGANNVLALQMNDEEVEVYDNWKNAPGALVVVDGQEVTRERKLLAWASDMAVQRSELRRTRMELAQAREEIRVLRAELSVLRMEVSEANIARAAAEARQLELERANSQLRLEVAASQASARSTMEEAVRLLTDLSDDGDASSSGGGVASTSASFEPASAAAASANGTSSSGSHGGGGGGMFGGLFGFNKPGSGNGKASSRVPGDEAGPAGAASGPGSAASAVVAAAAAMAAAADPWLHAGGGGGEEQKQAGRGSSSRGGYSPHHGSSHATSYSPPGGSPGAAPGSGGGSEVVSANAKQ